VPRDVPSPFKLPASVAFFDRFHSRTSLPTSQEHFFALICKFGRQRDYNAQHLLKLCLQILTREEVWTESRIVTLPYPKAGIQVFLVYKPQKHYQKQWNKARKGRPWLMITLLYLGTNFDDETLISMDKTLSIFLENGIYITSQIS
jgi:hypothetical protein